MMRAGRLRHRVTILEPAEAQDGFGGVAVTFSAWGSRWARVEPLTGEEYQRARATESRVSHRVTVRAPGLKGSVAPKWRIRHDGRAFEIDSVRDFEEREIYLLIDCVEITE